MSHLPSLRLPKQKTRNQLHPVLSQQYILLLSEQI
jgi:hypothetical protein